MDFWIKNLFVLSGAFVVMLLCMQVNGTMRTLEVKNIKGSSYLFWTLRTSQQAAGNWNSELVYNSICNPTCLWWYNYVTLSGISGLSFDSSFLSPLLFFCLVLLLFLSRQFSANGPFSWLFQKTLTAIWHWYLPLGVYMTFLHFFLLLLAIPFL